MRYAFEQRLTTIVAAADSLVEFEEFVKETDSTMVQPDALGVKSAEIADMMAMLSEENLQGFKKAPVIVEHLSQSARDKFNERFAIVVLKRNAVLDRQEDMLHAELDDPYAADYADPRPIEEIYDLDREDKWDKRSEEEKQQDLDMKKKLKELQKKGEISGDSFGPDPNRKRRVFDGEGKPTTDVDVPKGDQVHITDVRATRNSDGEIEIDDVLAVKGLHTTREGEGTYEERIKAPQKPTEGLGHTLATAHEREHERQAELIRAQAELDAAKPEYDDENLEIDTKGLVAIYHKVEVANAKLAHIRPALQAADIDLNMAIVSRNSAAGCWFAWLRQLQAEQSAEVLTKAGFTVETYAVNDAGERLAPKGVTVIDTDEEAEVLPRPWNFRARELRQMKAAERKANDKTIKPDEFIFVGNYEGAVHGTVIYITPKSYFKEHGIMWDKPLNIGHLLPADISEVTPGVYRSKSRDWNHISFDLNSRGFKENLMLQIALNAM